jgi:hypothetical protein
MLTPASNVSVTVYAHGTTTPVSIWSAESGGVTVGQPLTTGVGGDVPGWIDIADLPADLLAGGVVYYLGAAAVAGGGVTAFNSRSGAVTLAKADVTATGLAAADVGAAASSDLTAETTRAQAAEGLLTPLTQAVYVQPQPVPYWPSSETVITNFQSGFVVNSGTGILTLNDKSVPGYLGSGAMKVQTLTDNATTNIRNSVSLGGANLQNKTVKVLLYIQGTANVQDCTIYLGSDALGTYTNFATFNPTGTGSTFKPIQDGEWVWLTFSTNNTPASTTGSPNLAAINNIQIRCTPKNNQSVTYLFGGITVEPQPSGGYVSILFDDCWLSQFSVAAGMLDAYRYPVTGAVIADVIDNNNASYMSLAQMQALRDYHNWEFGCHAATTANHNAGFNALSDAQLVTEITSIKSWLLRNGFGRTADYLALPLGAYTLAQLPVYKRYFRAVRTLGGLTANNGRETFPPPDWNRLRAISVNASSGNTSPATTGPWITNAQANKEWLILLFHDVVASGATGIQINQSDFASVLSAVQSSGITVKSIGDMMRTQAP